MIPPKRTAFASPQGAGASLGTARREALASAGTTR